MKKLFFGVFLIASFIGNSQPIEDTTTLRTYINAVIVPNGTRAITAAQLNKILNGYLNTYPNDRVNATSPLVWNSVTRTMNITGWNASNWNSVYSWWISTGGSGSGGTTTIKSFADTTALTSSSFHTSGGDLIANLMGYNSRGDGGGKDFFWSSSSTATPDGIGVLKPLSVTGAGRWLEIFKGVVRASEAGVKADGTNQTTRLNSIFANATVKKVVFDNGPVTITGTVNFQGKIAAFDNGALLRGAGTVQNVLIEANPQVQIFDTTLTTTNALLNSDLSVTWFGAKADAVYNNVYLTGTDNYTAFTKALRASADLNDFKYTLYKTKLHIPTGPKNYGYLINRTIEIEFGIEVYGDGIENTVLYFPPRVKGIWIKYGGYQTTSKNCFLHDFMISGYLGHAQESEGQYDHVSHGIEINSPYNKLENVKIQFFNGDGIHIYGNTSPYIADHNSVINCQSIGNGGSGMMLVGADANVNIVRGGTYEGNAIWGICDSSFLGNNVADIHTSSNGFHTKGKSLVHRSGSGYMAIQPSIGIDPGTTPGWQTYWRFTGFGSVSSYYPDWSVDSNYVVSGAMYLYNVNSLGQYDGIYSEGGQYEGRNDGNGLVVGGFMGRFMQGNGPIISSLLGAPAIRNSVRVGNFETHDWATLSKSQLLFENGATTGSYGWGFDISNGNISMLYAGGSTGLYYFFQDFSASSAGRAAWPQKYNLATEGGIFTKAYDEPGFAFRNLGTSNVKPPDSYGGNGDILFKVGGVSDTLGWKRVAGIWTPLMLASSVPDTVAFRSQFNIAAGTPDTVELAGINEWDADQYSIRKKTGADLWEWYNPSNLTGLTSYSVDNGADASFTISKHTTSLGVITANRTVTFPAGALDGTEIILLNTNTSGTFSWTSATTIYNPDGTTFTALANAAVYTIVKIGGLWKLVHKQL